ncbi:MAG: hypothetical protein LLG14_19620 [Nocardiaceae bacterium]|nr:hypothetical protein [Nocardiaceae bacterium]
MICVILACQSKGCPRRHQTAQPPSDGKWWCPSHRNDLYAPTTARRVGINLERNEQ